MSDGVTAKDSAPEGKERFPRFAREYRDRWVSAGLWLDRTLHDLFDETVSANPDGVAIVTDDHRISFREFKDAADALAAGLRGAEIGPGDLVTVQLPNWPEFCFLQIALSRIGAVIHPMHVTYREREIESLLRFCESDAIVVPESFDDFNFVEAVRGMRARLPSLRLLVAARGGRTGEGEVRLDSLIEEGRKHPDRLDTAASDPDAVYYINFTSGTEGEPKGFMHTHNTLVSYMKRLADLLKAMNPVTVNLTCSPMTHSFGHLIPYFTALVGFPIVFVDRYRPLPVIEQIDRERVTTLSGTPAHLAGILHYPEFSAFDTSSVKQVMTGGARSSPELIEELGRVWGIKASNAYGMGETIVHTQTMPFDLPEKIRETVGRPFPGMELKIVDPEGRDAEMPTGEAGEIAFRGPTLFVGYYKQPDLTRQTRDDAGWFYTGDLGFVDEEGYLHFVGRRMEVINRGGTKIFPKEIEDLLVAHPKVTDAAVVGMPDERLGERVCAYLVPVNGAELTLEEIADYLREQRVTKHKIPERLIITDHLPMTPTGKVRKATLLEDIAARLKQESATAQQVGPGGGS